MGRFNSKVFTTFHFQYYQEAIMTVSSWQLQNNQHVEIKMFTIHCGNNLHPLHRIRQEQLVHLWMVMWVSSYLASFSQFLSMDLGTFSILNHLKFEFWHYDLHILYLWQEDHLKLFQLSFWMVFWLFVLGWHLHQESRHSPVFFYLGKHSEGVKMHRFILQ